MSELVRLEDAVEFAENPEPRCPCILLLDVSGSMQGAPIDALNAGLKTFAADLAQDSLAARRVEVAIVTFASDVNVVGDFITADQFEPPTLAASGSTLMGTGIQKSLDLLSARKQVYREYGVAYFRPWVFMVTDGEPQGEERSIIEQASARIHEEEENKRVAFFAVGVQGANIEKLKSIAARGPLKLDGLNFRDMFLWLSASMQRVSQSKPGEQVALPPAGWGTV